MRIACQSTITRLELRFKLFKYARTKVFRQMANNVTRCLHGLVMFNTQNYRLQEPPERIHVKTPHMKLREVTCFNPLK